MRSGEFDEYSATHLERLKYILADIYSGLGRISDDLYLVGGLVADLLVRNKLVYLKEYLGTLDIDLALKFAVRGKSKLSGFYRKLREIGFEKQKTADGSDIMSHSFIKYEGGYKPVVLDLLIDDKFKPKADKLKEIAPGVEAVKFRGVCLVFKDFLVRQIKRRDEHPLEIKIANIIPFLTLKLFAYANRVSRLNKDAFDIWYVIVNYKEGPDSVREELIKYKDNADVKEALKVIPALFGEETSEGVRDVGNILVRRYGLDINFARREVLAPFQKLDLR
ncbi:MAG: hypothetical protein A3G37_03815 [Omnitrophica WOR_2 bacterium RIFCSPLOWO2_12_FULL_46_30]|nr:MAG: hypothetical protein A3G37_03815 [Omnitrophica WOR_2 bacterium RIFCSPLOWO2_12_FULL_46_30]